MTKDCCKHNSGQNQLLDSSGSRERKMTKTPERLLMEFDPTPSHKVQDKIDFFFMPYNFESNVSKFMKFKNDDFAQNMKLIPKLRKLSNDPYLP